MIENEVLNAPIIGTFRDLIVCHPILLVNLKKWENFPLEAMGVFQAFWYLGSQRRELK